MATTDQARPSHPLPAAILAAVCCTSVCVLTFEISLTRILSVLLRYDYLFLSLSSATCGLGLGGLAAFFAGRRWARVGGSDIFAAWAALACGLCVPSGLALALATPLSAHLASIPVILILFVPPFFAAGMVLSHVFGTHARRSGKLYWADLSGASLGCLLSIVMLNALGGINAALLSGTFAFAAAALLFIADGTRRRAALPAALAVLTVACVALNMSSPFLGLPTLPCGHDSAAARNYKYLYRELGDPATGARVSYTAWTAFARTDVVEYAGGPTLVYTDGEVPSEMVRFDGDTAALRARYARSTVFFPFKVFGPKSVFLVGPGAGLDILMSLAAGVETIDGAEINPSMRHILRRYETLAGRLYDYPNVTIRDGEGRAVLSGIDKRYDMIFVALAKTATTANVSLALSECYGLTLEAFLEYFDHLSDNGCLAFINEQPLLLIRALLTAREAVIKRTGVPGPLAMRHIAVVQLPPERFSEGPHRNVLLVTRRALTLERAEALAAHARESGLVEGFVPWTAEHEPFEILARKEVSSKQYLEHFKKSARFAAGHPLDLLPATDNQPFFVDAGFGLPSQFYHSLWIIALLIVCLTVGAQVWTKRRGADVVSPGVIWRSTGYFFCIGTGFMLVEVVLIQRFMKYLGYPVLTFSVILFSLLVCAGLGGAASQRWVDQNLKRLAILALCSVAILCGVLHVLLPGLYATTAACPLWLRSLFTMLLLAPLGFFMGMPFPAAIRMLALRRSEEMVPWVWGVNGLSSVIGSLGAMVLAKLAGFNAAALAGILAYLLAPLFLWYRRAPR